MPLLSSTALPDAIADTAALEDLLARPTQALIDDLATLDGDIMVLGVGGKMGPTVAALAKAAAPGRRVVGVARFSEPDLAAGLHARGVETIRCDLMDDAQLASLPKIRNIVFMAGRKFDASGAPALTWAMNSYMPAQVAQVFNGSRIVAFSTGCVYPFVPVAGAGADERVPLDPPGEYAQSCVGRERMFEFFSQTFGTPGRLLRLNYAIDMRYGVLHDIARKILDGAPIDLAMGHVNLIWQGDAAAQALRCLARCTAPTSPINVSGDRILAVRDLAAALGGRLGRTPVLTGRETATAWVTDTSLAVREFGMPVVDLDHMLDWTADWVARRMPSHGKPTKFEVRDGRY